MIAQAPLPAAGQVVRVRQRLYLVEETVSPPRAGDATLLRLACVDDDAQGQPLEVLWEFELDGEILTAEAWDAIATRGFDPPDRFGAYLNVLKWNCVTSTDPQLLQSPFRAGIRLDAYQLEPLRKALRLPRVNLFIADDVGLGKTIEAGLIARELLLRKKAREIVVACPPSMLFQWQDELEARFGLRFEILDKDYVQRVRSERGFGVNPWTTHSRFLVSQRLLIDDAYKAPLLDWLGDFRPGSLLILDEAHHAAPSSGRRYAIDSQITRAIRELAKRFEHRLFLSATPHNGHSNSFSALLEILDPQRFCRGVPVSRNGLEAVMVRRLKEDLREIQGGFPKRIVEQVVIDNLPADSPELRLATLLDEYRRLREERLAGESRRTQTASGLLITNLQQRLLSSVEAFARTLAVHRRTVQRQWQAAQSGGRTSSATVPRTEHLFEPVAADDDRSALPEEELAAEQEAEVAAVSDATTGDVGSDAARALFERELRLLDEMAQIADSARYEADGRVRALTDWIRRNMFTSGAWNRTRVIIFTEYDDTKRYLERQLRAATEGSERAEERIAIYHGPTSPADREAIKNAFNADPDKHPVRILIATDAAREGLNLQAHCSNLFHFDVPWNPGRMEQRNGRIDRKLQPSPEVYCRYFFYKQRPEDRVLAALVRKTKTIREELGSLSQVIDNRLESLLKSGIRRREVDAIEKAIDAADLDPERKEACRQELESARQRQVELQEQIDSLRTMLDRSRQQIGFQEDQFRAAISCALDMLGADKLKPVATEETPPRLSFPALDQRAGADPSWAETMDSLRAPREKDQKFWEWRRSSPIRPVVFEDPGKVTDEVVQLHLEHRVVQRLLARFTAQGFVHHDLSRACLAQTRDAIPRVILIGRLALYGPHAARLHEELIVVTARWTSPSIRKEPLAPYAREAEAKTLNLLDQALLSRTQPVSEIIAGQLQAAAPRDVRELLPHLEKRGAEYAKDANVLLAKRAEKEAGDMRLILETQRKHIEETIARHNRSRQLELDFSEEEKRQLEDNRRYWDKRLASLVQELEDEPERIRALYNLRAQRTEPVGLVYLWPVSR